jgi:hypothetical protein
MSLSFVLVQVNMRLKNIFLLTVEYSTDNTFFVLYLYLYLYITPSQVLYFEDDDVLEVEIQPYMSM